MLNSCLKVIFIVAFRYKMENHETNEDDSELSDAEKDGKIGQEEKLRGCLEEEQGKEGVSGGFIFSE